MNASQEKVWWGYLLSGVLFVLLGWMVLAKPISAVISLVLFFGFYLLVSGIVQVVMSFFGIGKKGSAWGWELVAGIFSVIVGLMVLNNTLFTSVFTSVMFMYAIAFSMIFSGVVGMFAGRKTEKSGNFVWTWGGFFLGLLYLAFGLYLLASPTRYAVSTVVLASGWFAIIIGGTSIVYAFVDKNHNNKVTA
uniref:HdeD family acid-resistance protein n=1 Tax=candidate division WWE3 bacterium TaxID=2053526 RepID=A0A7C4Y2Q2_UNCKA